MVNWDLAEIQIRWYVNSMMQGLSDKAWQEYVDE